VSVAAAEAAAWRRARATPRPCCRALLPLQPPPLAPPRRWATAASPPPHLLARRAVKMAAADSKRVGALRQLDGDEEH
jgi:hypothetical protein